MHWINVLSLSALVVALVLTLGLWVIYRWSAYCYVGFEDIKDLSNDATVLWDDGQRCPQVDVVFLWVNGDDATHAMKRCAQRRRIENGQCRSSAGQIQLCVGDDRPKRFKSHGELSYAVECARWALGPMLRKLWVVVDQQMPPEDVFVAADRLPITVVHHHDFVPQRLLPCFNSDILSAYVHRIPGLLPWTLVSAQDTLYSKVLSPSDLWVKPGVARLVGDRKAMSARLRLALSCAKPGRTTLSRHYTDMWLNQHGVRPTYRPWLSQAPVLVHVPTLKRAVENFRPSLTELYSGHHFRQADDVIMVKHYYAYFAQMVGKAQITHDHTVRVINWSRKTAHRHQKWVRVPADQSCVAICVNHTAADSDAESADQELACFLSAHTDRMRCWHAARTTGARLVAPDRRKVSETTHTSHTSHTSYTSHALQAVPADHERAREADVNEEDVGHDRFQARFDCAASSLDK